MRIHIDQPTRGTLCFEDDAPDGGCIVQCPDCGHIFNEKDLDECPSCHSDLVFPGWASW